MPRRGTGRKAGNSKKGPVLRLSKTSVVLNKCAREALGSQSVELAYDADSKTIRVGPGTIPMKKTKVFAKGFFNAFGIEGKGSYPAEVREGFLYAELG